MDCLGPECASMLLDWLHSRVEGRSSASASAQEKTEASVQGTLWSSEAFREELPTIRTKSEYLGAVEHLEYSVFRRYQNQLTRAERSRLDNTIANTIFKVDRYLERLSEDDRDRAVEQVRGLKDEIRAHKELAERTRIQARRADQKIAQLASLNPEGFEEFVGELFEALGYEVEQVGGSGDEGADLRVTRGDLRGVVQCKYHKQGVIGSPHLQKFLGTIRHTRSHKGFYVTTSTFSLSAEKFVSDHPIELIDGPRLVELVREAIGPTTRQEPELAWF